MITLPVNVPNEHRLKTQISDGASGCSPHGLPVVKIPAPSNAPKDCNLPPIPKSLKSVARMYLIFSRSIVCAALLDNAHPHPGPLSLRLKVKAGSGTPMHLQQRTEMRTLINSWPSSVPDHVFPYFRYLPCPTSNIFFALTVASWIFRKAYPISRSDWGIRLGDLQPYFLLNRWISQYLAIFRTRNRPVMIVATASG